MKTKHISYILALGISLLIYSCENVIEFSGKTTKPLLVVNGFISPDSLIKVHVSKSKFFLQDNSSYESVNNATVNVWVNGTKTEKLVNIGEGYYQASFKPQIGTVIKITAENTEFSEVSTYTDVVAPNPILSADTTNHIFKEYPNIDRTSQNGVVTLDTMGFSKFEDFDVHIKFKDPANQANFYKLNLKILNHYDNDSTTLNSTWFSSDDIVFGNGNTSGPFDTGSYSYDHEFSDELFNGKEYKLKLTFGITTYIYKDKTLNKEQKTPLKQELYIELQSISESYFKYIRSRSTSAGTIEFFSEPVQIFSNVSGGIGILGSYSSSVYKIQLK